MGGTVGEGGSTANEGGSQEDAGDAAAEAAPSGPPPVTFTNPIDIDIGSNSRGRGKAKSGCYWYSDDLANWTQIKPNWPTSVRESELRATCFALPSGVRLRANHVREHRAGRFSDSGPSRSFGPARQPANMDAPVLCEERHRSSTLVPDDAGEDCCCCDDPKAQNTRDLAHDYVPLAAPVIARYMKITNEGEIPGGGEFSVRDLRVFGTDGPPPSMAPAGVIATRGPLYTSYQVWRRDRLERQAGHANARQLTLLSSKGSRR